MEIWADDPWADNPATPNKEAGDEAPAFAKPTAVLNGFEDEAGWGDFESSEDKRWDADSWAETGGHIRQEAAVDLPSSNREIAGQKLEALQEHADDNVGTSRSPLPTTHGVDDAVQLTVENSPSRTRPQIPAVIETSDGEDRKTESNEDEVGVEPVEERNAHSRHLSTSSEGTTSSGTASFKSDRTSIEQGVPDSRTRQEDNGVLKEADIVVDEPSSATSLRHLDDTEAEHADPSRLDLTSSSASPVSSVPTVKTEADNALAFVADLELLKKLFRSQSEKKGSSTPPPQDLIDSTSTRKLWYRLSRPQTLRGFLSGDMEDAHVRVSWSNSHIRSDTVKIVSRWTAEDRIHGRTMLGLPASVSFGWDEPRTGTLGRHTASKSVSAAEVSSTQAHLPQLRPQSISIKATNTEGPVASFAWSTSPRSPTFPNVTTDASPRGSSTKTDNPWRHSIVSGLSSLQVSSASLDAVSSDHLQGPDRMHSMHSDPAPGSHATLETPQETATSTAEAPQDMDGDDDWGEMVHSPTLPNLPDPQASRPSGPGLDLSAQRSMMQKDSLQERTATPPRSPVLPKQIIPEGPLSPARRAAFGAARVTRSLSSQHQSTLRAEGKTVLEPTATTSRQLPLAGSAMPTSNLFDDDMTLEESNCGLRAPAGNLVLAEFEKAMLTSEDQQRLDRFLAQIPDLSYMFR